MRPIRRALISVSDKTGVVEFARALQSFGVELLSTGGTAKALRDAGLEVQDVADVTGFPEMMDGRVKTLHPRIHGGLLAVRDNSDHVASLEKHGIVPIDLVVIDLYPFERTIAREGVTLDEAVEHIDIGGPAMIRSAAKNWRDVVVVVSPRLYDYVIDKLRNGDGALSLPLRRRLAAQAFKRTASYDQSVYTYLHAELEKDGFFKPEQEGEDIEQLNDDDAGRDDEKSSQTPFAENIIITLDKLADLRYGENPHQKAALYDIGERNGIVSSVLLSGKEMSFNNYVDADAAWQLVCDFDTTACAIIKHTNPAGVGLGSSPAEAYQRALATDPVSAFGGIVAFNCQVDEDAARLISELFIEVIVAPDYDNAAIEMLSRKKNLRILSAPAPERIEDLEYKTISGGMLVQTRDTRRVSYGDLRTATKRSPSEEEARALLFAWTVCKHTKSNAIVYARGGQTIGVGAGQMSRVDSVRIGAARAQLPVAGSVLASDAFFPFRDGVDEAARHGITAIIQPGGSVRDAEVIAAADQHNMAMVFTGVRHFKH
ncbi:MAG: bifunctional phosphoribosylaminoimidazolecarboxamide formyltransferase/IMP cyclohydrolase [Acidobacteriota bacterium]|nr:bifunctional phosphoribosylaminoimidazolecarboxamide formyltransferase/IMP cyclohydrolase [Acidobacteriota bacterium]